MKKLKYSLFVIAAVVSQMSYAAMPQVTAPAGVAEGNYIGLIQWGIGAAIALLALALAGFGLVSVGGSALKKFREFGDGRADIGEVIAVSALGVVVLFVAVGLAYAATQVIPVNLV